MINTKYWRQKSGVWASACTLFLLGFCVAFMTSSHATAENAESKEIDSRSTESKQDESAQTEITAHYSQINPSQCVVDFLVQGLSPDNYRVDMSLEVIDAQNNSSRISQTQDVMIAKEHDVTPVQKLTVNPFARNAVRITISNVKTANVIVEKSWQISQCKS